MHPQLVLCCVGKDRVHVCLQDKIGADDAGGDASDSLLSALRRIGIVQNVRKHLEQQFTSTRSTMTAIPEDYATILRNSHAKQYLSAAGFVALLYDHLLTLDDEVRYVWPGKMNVSKALFLFNRYVVPMMMAVGAYDFSGLSGGTLSDTSDGQFFVNATLLSCMSSCKTWFAIALYLGTLCLANANFVILLRLWVLWGRARKLVLWTLVGFIVTHLATFGVVTLIAVQIRSIVQNNPTFGTCDVTNHSMLRPVMAAFWTPGIIFECMVFAATWLNAIARPRSANEQLSKSLYRDGFAHFFVLLALRVMNLVLAISAPRSLTLLGLYFVFSMASITFSRLVLNLRRIAFEAQAHHSDCASDCTEWGDYTQTKLARTYRRDDSRGHIEMRGIREV